MDVFGWNRCILSFLGFDVKYFNPLLEETTNDKSSRWTRILICLKKLKFFVVVSIMISGGSVLVACSVFSTVPLNAKLISITLLLFLTVETTTVWWTHRNFLRITKAMAVAVKQLNNESMTRLRKIDRMGIIIRMIWTYVPGLIILFFYLRNTIDTAEFLNLLNLKSFYAKVPYRAALFLSRIFLMWVGNFYWLVLSLAYESAENCRVIIRNLKQNRMKLLNRNGNHESVTEDFQIAKITLKKYLKFVDEINGSVGIIPMSLFILLFMHITVALSLSFLFDDSTGFVLFGIVGMSISNKVFNVIQIIMMATKATNTIRAAVIEAEKLIAIPLLSRSCPQVLEFRRSLRIFLQSQTNVVFSAMSTFVLQPSIVLSFFNAIVPFTVMFITTIIQIRENNTTHTEGFKANVTSTKTGVTDQYSY